MKNGPALAVRGSSFSFTVEVSSLGPDVVSGVVVAVEQPGATNLVVPTDCVGTGGAVCPADWAVSGSRLTGTLGAFPANGKVSFTFTGKFTTDSSVSSVSTTAALTLPSGVTDSNLGGNTSFQATTFVDPSASVVKSVALASNPSVLLNTDPNVLVPSGSEFLWTIRVTNTGAVPLAGGIIEDYYEYSGSGFSFDNIVGSLTCDVNGVACSPSITLNPTGNPFGGYLAPASVPDIPVGGVLTVTFRSKATKTTCGKGSFRNGVVYFAFNKYMDRRESSYIFMNPGDCPPPPSAAISKSVALASNPSVPLNTDPNVLIPLGSEFVWTIKVTNTGTVPLTGGSLIDYYYSDPGFSFENIVGSLTCDVNGVACSPSITLNPTGDPFDRTVVPDIPVGGVLTVTFRSKATKTTCGRGSFQNTVNYYFDKYRGSRISSYIFMNPGDCPSVSVVKSVALASNPTVPLNTDPNVLIPLGSEFLWTIRVTNTGTVPLTGGGLIDYYYLGSGGFVFENIVGSLTCDVNGVACSPSITLNPTGDPFGRTVVPDIPAGGVLTVTFRSKATKTTCGKDSFRNGVEYFALNKYMDGGQSSYIFMSGFDLGVSVVPLSQVVVPGGDFWLEASFQNGCAVPADTRLSWQLPSAQDFVFAGVTPASVQCTAPAGKTCPVFSFDEATRVLSAQFVGVDTGQFKVKVIGKAGVVKGVSSPTTVRLLSPSGGPLGDVNPSSDAAQVTYDIQNVRNTNNVTYNITAKNGATTLPGVPVDMAVTGKMVCVTQGEFPWNLTIVKDTQSGSWQQGLWSGDTCHFVVDPVSAPSGWRWKTVPTITSTDQGLSAVQDGDRQIMVTGELEPLVVGLAVEKLGVNCDVGQPSCPLSGAAFTIYNTNPALVGATTVGTLTVDSTASPVGYRFLVSGLTVGDYWLVESRAATGFALLAQPVQFRLAADGTITLLSPDTAIVTIRPGTTTPATPATLVVHDQPVVNLPKAGGPGIWWLALAGALLLATGLTLHRTTRHQT